MQVTASCRTPFPSWLLSNPLCMVLRRSLFCLLLSSAIDFYCSVERITGASGEPRVLIKFNGKHLPHIDQEQANDTS
jgi:hypothetical protein